MKNEKREKASLHPLNLPSFLHPSLQDIYLSRGTTPKNCKKEGKDFYMTLTIYNLIITRNLVQCQEKKTCYTKTCAGLVSFSGEGGYSPGSQLTCF